MAVDHLDQLAEDIDAELEEASSSTSSDIEIIEITEQPEPLDAPPPLPETPNGTNKLKKMRCPICLETPEIVAVAPCGHIYCHECVFEALSSVRKATMVEGQCSICRKRVRYDGVLYMEMKTGSQKETNKETNHSA